MRQGVREVVVQRMHVHRLVRRPHDVGHDDRTTRRSALEHGRRLRDAGDSREMGIDVPGLDTQAVDLHLLVVAPQIIQPQGAVRANPAHGIAGAVEAFAGGAYGIGHEPRRGDACAVEVATRQTGTTEVEFADHSDRHRPQPGVEHERRHSPDRFPDRHRLPGPEIVGAGRPDRGLRGSVVVHQPTTRRPPGDDVRARRLADHRDDPQLRQTRRVHRVEHRRRDDGVGHPLGPQQVLEVGTAVDLRRRDGQAGAGAVRDQHLRHAGVEAGGRDLQDRRIRFHREGFRVLDHQVGEAAMGDVDGLRPAGGAGREDQIGRVVRPERERVPGTERCRVVGTERERAGSGEGQPLDGVREARDDGVDGHPDRGPRVGEQFGDAVGRIARVDGDEGRSGPGDRPDRHDERGRPRDRQGHRGLRSGAAGGELVGEPVAAAHEFAICHRDAVGAHRRCLGVSSRGVGEDVPE